MQDVWLCGRGSRWQGAEASFYKPLETMCFALFEAVVCLAVVVRRQPYFLRASLLPFSTCCIRGHIWQRKKSLSDGLAQDLPDPHG